jgi:hypothetical protein
MIITISKETGGVFLQREGGEAFTVFGQPIALHSQRTRVVIRTETLTFDFDESEYLVINDLPYSGTAKQIVDKLRDEIFFLAGGNTIFGYAANYSALPSASAANENECYAVLNSQGTAWLPGSLGGTYYSKGIYYSDGATWSFLGSAPHQATQAQVNAESATDVFVAPSTLGQWYLQKGSSAVVIDVVSISSSTTISPTRETLYLIDTTGSGFTVFLPTAAGKTGLRVHLCKTATANTLTIDANGSETINGSLTAPIYKQNEVLTIVSDGTNWRVI